MIDIFVPTGETRYAEEGEWWQNIHGEWLKAKSTTLHEHPIGTRHQIEALGEASKAVINFYGPDHIHTGEGRIISLPRKPKIKKWKWLYNINGTDDFDVTARRYATKQEAQMAIAPTYTVLSAVPESEREFDE